VNSSPTPDPPPSVTGAANPKQAGRIEKGTARDDPLAGILAAAAATPSPLDERAYRRFVAEADEDWLTVHDLVKRYGSFTAALHAAGIQHES
jgi:hypothetical protein